MRPVNLIPPEDRRGEHAPLRAGALSYAIVGFLALALVGVVLMVMARNDVAEKQSELAALDARLAQADLTASQYADYERFASLAQARDETISSLARTRFDWERVLSELALVIPRRVTIVSLSGTVSSAAAAGAEDPAASGSPAGITGPSLQMSGCAKGQTGVARLLASLRDIDGVTRVGMQSSELGDQAQDGAATAAVGDSAAATGDSGDCQVRPGVARFEATVAFDAVPTPATAVPPAGTAPEAAPAGDSSGIAEAQATQEEAAASAEGQVSEAQEGAEIVGADAQ